MQRLVTDYLDKIAERFPEKKAFVSSKGSMTFGELCTASRRVAMGLVTRRLIRKPIVVYMEKTPACIAAFLGTAYSGNFYTPLDMKMPTACIEKIMDALKPAAIIADSTHLSEARALADGALVLS